MELYKIGEIYFVKDGNHRVSVAREQGQTFIDAYVTEIKTNIELTPDINLEEIILKNEYAQFLKEPGKRYLPGLRDPAFPGWSIR